jgi:hypothetical protein
MQLRGPDEANKDSTDQNKTIGYKYHIEYGTSGLPQLENE